MNKPESVPADGVTLECHQRVDLQLHDTLPMRTLMIGRQEDKRVAIFGYFDSSDQWHSTIVPVEFHPADVLQGLLLFLKHEYQAVLITVPGDTINEQLQPRPV